MEKEKIEKLKPMLEIETLKSMLAKADTILCEIIDYANETNNDQLEMQASYAQNYVNNCEWLLLAQEADERSEQETTSFYWDCECEKNYIHPKDDPKCLQCGAVHYNQPDSRINEVKEHYYGKKA